MDREDVLDRFGLIANGFLESNGALGQFVRTHIDGMRSFVRIYSTLMQIGLGPIAARVAAEDDGTPNAAVILKRIRDDAEQEVSSEFGYLFEMAAVRIWTNLDATIRDFSINLLQHEDTWKTHRRARGIKGPVVEFAVWPRGRQLGFLLDALTTESRVKYSPGVGRFEGILNLLDLGGPVPAAVGDALLQLSETRHVVVHRQGLADERFLERCPWVNATAGQKLRLTQREYLVFVNASVAYVAEVGRRLAEKGLMRSVTGVPKEEIVKMWVDTTDTAVAELTAQGFKTPSSD